MTRKQIVGFEIGTIKECSSITNVSYISIQQTKTRNSSYAARIHVPSADVSYSNFFVGAPNAYGGPGTMQLDKLCATFDFLVDSIPSVNKISVLGIMSFFGGAVAFLHLDNNSHLILTDSVNTTLYTYATNLSLNTWYNIGISVEKANGGAWEFMIDGDVKSSGTGNFGGNVIGGCYFGSGIYASDNNNTVDMYFDNIVYDDTTLAPKAIVKLLPAVSGSPYKAEWTQGTSADYTAVDDVPSDGDTTYIQIDTSGKEHNVVHDTCANQGITGSDTIGAVKTWLTFKKGDTGYVNGLIALGSDGTNYLNGSNYISGDTSWYDFCKIWPTDPADSGAWTTAKIDQAQSGIRSYSNGASAKYWASNLGFMLDYTPPDVVDITVDLDLQSFTSELQAPAEEVSYTIDVSTQTLTGVPYSPTVHAQAVEDISYVVYKSYTKLNCACTSGRTEANSIVICLDTSKTDNGAPFIEGWIDSYFCTTDACGQTLYNYTLSYDPHQLLDPESTLYSIDISAVFCRGCLTKYIDWKAPFIQSQPNGYILQLPEGFPAPGQVLGVLSIESNVIVLGWIGGGN